MRLKYYLRGLGTGILFATLILFISYSYHYSDAKIKEKAKELGMVESETYKQSLLDGTTTVDKTTTNSDADSTTKPSDTETSGDETTSKENVTSKEETTTKKEEVTTKKEETTTKKPEVTTTKKEEITTTKKQEVTTTIKQEETTTKNPSEQPTTGNNKTEYVITISRGMSSEKVAEALRVAGAIEDARDFNTFLIRNGHSERIRVGTFTIPAGSSYEQIADIIS